MIEFQGEEAMAHVRAETWKRIQAAGVYTQNKIMEVLNVPNSGERRKRTRNTAVGKKGSSYTVYANPSRPGEPPHKITGFLQGNVAIEEHPGELRVRVGIRDNAYYGIFLEEGTKNMDARPFLKFVITAYRPQIAAMADGVIR